MSMTTPTYPGVYVTEVPSGNRTIAGVATSITAFVGRALRGPVDEPVPISSYAEFVRAFGPLWRDSGLGYAVRDFYLNGGGPALVVRVARGAVAATIDAGGIDLVANGPGAWGSALTATVTHPTDADAAEIAAAQGLADGSGLFTLTLRLGPDADPEVVETFVNVTVGSGPRRIDNVLTGSRLARVDGTLPGARPAEGDYIVGTDGDDGDAPEAEDYFPAGDDKVGVRALLKADLVNILVLPPVAPAASLPDAVWADALAFAARNRIFLIVDPPPGLTIDQVRAWPSTGAGLGGTDTRYAAMYYPRVKMSDPAAGGAIGEFAASGAAAGIMARTDATRGVWKAAAGLEAGVNGALGPSVALTDDENGRLNPDGINVIRTFPGTGTVLWGARTLRGADRLADDYKYAPVRRLALYIEESLYRGTQWVVFEPNDEPLWSQIRLSVGSFMQDLFRKGAFQGASPREAFFVRCSADTTTQYDIDRGIVNIEVGFAPLKPAEFVMISIQQMTAAQE